jgi:hypothetical protein
MKKAKNYMYINSEPVQKIEDPIKNLVSLAVFITGFLFTYFCGYITLKLLWIAELIELPYTDQFIFLLTLAAGVPFLLAQIAIMKYSKKIVNELF